MPPTGRMKRWLPIGAVIVLLGGAVASIQRIPPQSLGIGSGRIVEAGWRFHAPFAPYRTVAGRGHIDVPGLEIRTKEGSALTFRLVLDYALGASLAPRMAADIRRDGLEPALSAFAGTALAETARATDIESLLSSPAMAESALAAAYRGAGIQVESLSLRSSLGDEMVRRKHTAQAMSLVERPLARILVIGWDGADWRSAAPLMAAGRMPNLARLVREGASGDLRSYDPMFSPLLWTTVATGKPPTEHGIADFLVKDAATGERHPITSDFRKVKALWNILSDFDRPSEWIGWWASYPAESIRGTVVTDYLAAAATRAGGEGAAALPGVVSPADALRGRAGALVGAAQITRAEVSRIIPVTDSDYSAGIASLVEPHDTKKPGARTENPVTLVLRALAQNRTYQALALGSLRSGVPFVAVYFETIDIMGHGFQHYLPPKMSFVSDADYERFHEAVTHAYELQDQELGELLDAAGDGTFVVLLSDHGFRTGDDRPNFSPSTHGQPEEWHREWGIVALHGPGIRPGRIPPASIFDVTPTLLYAAGLPLAEDMPGRVMEAAFEPSLLARRPRHRTKSFELVGAAMDRDAAPRADPEVMREMMANLKALGYVGGSDEPPPRSETAPAVNEKTETQFFFHRNLATSYMRQGRYRDAEGELLLANERQPRAKTYALLSEVRAADGRFAEAAAALDEGWSHVPDDMEPSSVLWIVELRLLAGDAVGAAAAARRWDARMPEAVKLACSGRLAEANGDPAGAAALYRRALETDPLLVRVALRLQAIEASAGRPLSLEPFLDSTLAAHPKVDAYWDLAGQIALARGDASSAIERFRRATEIDPDNGQFLGHLASAYAAAGRAKEARDTLDWADRFAPRDAEGWMAIGSAWDRLGETDRAVGAFDRARRSGAAGPAPDLGAALTLARAGRIAEARRILDDSAQRFPGSEAVRSLRSRLDR